MNEGITYCLERGEFCGYATLSGYCGISVCINHVNSTTNYCAVQGRYPNCYLCQKYNGALNCNEICNGESAFVKLESVTVTNATEQMVIKPTEQSTTIEQEICKLNRTIEYFNEKIKMLFDREMKGSAEIYKFAISILESRRKELGGKE